MAAPNWLTIMGITDPSDGDWAMVRGSQLAEVKRFAVARFVISALAAIAMFVSLRPTLGGPALIAWFAGSILVFGALALPHLRDRTWTSHMATRKDLHRETLSSVVSAACWAFVPLYFGKNAASTDLVTIWTVTTAIMAGMTVALSAVPVATTAFLIVAGSGLAAMTWFAGFTMITATAFAYSAALIAGCFANGRSFVMRRSAESELAEKDEVVSLLLREFEDSGGDWMWQIDASKCLTHVSPRFAYALGARTRKPGSQAIACKSWPGQHGKPGISRPACAIWPKSSRTGKVSAI